MSPEEIKEIIKDYDALIVRSQTQVTEDILNSADHLRVVARAGVGVDNIDINAATKKGSSSSTHLAGIRLPQQNIQWP